MKRGQIQKQTNRIYDSTKKKHLPKNILVRFVVNYT